MKTVLRISSLLLMLGLTGIYGAGASTSSGNSPGRDHNSQEKADHEDHGHRQEHPQDGKHSEPNHAGKSHDSEKQDNDHGKHVEHGHGEEGHDEGGPGEVHLTPAQIQTLGLRIERLQPIALEEILRAPGEVRLNAYASAQVAPRIEAQVTERHARLGDHVDAGQPMVSLSSVEMAEAQGNLVVAEREWQRVRKLGRKVVSESRYLEAKIGQQQGRARVVAFGMADGQLEELLRSGASKADGSFVLLAPQAGTVVADDFVLGEVVEAGRTLFEITDESVRWVEARMAAEDVERISIDDPVRVTAGTIVLNGKVIQVHHQLDEMTRTQAIRIGLPDPQHRLHPGTFVDVSVFTGTGEPVLAVPEEAVLRGVDGDWEVFVTGDETGSFQPMEVDLLRTSDGLAVIGGLEPGTQVVSRGAFFLQSELAKGGFDIHQH